ncbi:hypothetical protein [Streptomyces sp. NPDC053069]|uniref:hypothetical protein n=1 Tax=Streptomyces sp. NPDC053069 TaxID=3365695 RepID=UPI0037D13EBD
MENHDTCAKGLLATLAVIETEQLADRVTVVRRDGSALYTNELTPGGGWRRRPAAERVVRAERARPWTASETAVFRRDLARTDRRVHTEVAGEDRRLAVQRDSHRRGLGLHQRLRLGTPRPPDTGDHTGLDTAADALVELLSALTRRQDEHRARTVDRLTAVLDTRLLPTELDEMALYYRAKAGLAGDFPTAHAAAQTLGWEGRHQRVLGDLWWLQGEPERAAAAYLAGRTEAEQHAKAGEAAHNQALRALAVAFYDPHRADDEIDLAHQLLANLDLRATTINAATAALIRDAGDPALDDRIHTLRTELDIAGLTSMTPTLELAAAFHQAVLDDHDALAATLSRLREQTQNGDYAYYIDIASFMADLPLPVDHTAPQWLDGEQATRTRWRAKHCHHSPAPP